MEYVAKYVDPIILHGDPTNQEECVILKLIFELFDTNW